MAGPADATAIAAIYRPYVTDAATSFEIDPPDASEMRRRMAALDSFAPWLVYVEQQREQQEQPEIVGYAYASPHRDRAAYRWSVDVTVYVRGDRHRRGVGRALYQTLLPLLALQGFRVAHAGITLPNPGSVGLHAVAGLRSRRRLSGRGLEAGGLARCRLVAAPPGRSARGPRGPAVPARRPGAAVLAPPADRPHPVIGGQEICPARCGAYGRSARDF